MSNAALALPERWERPPSFAVRLEFFSGPMDLLLHLVHQREVSLAEVEMREICEQYLAIISRAAVLDLERATEYLVIAATLTAMKSQSLLAADTGEGGESEWYDGHFFESLRDRLMAYERTKRRAESLLSRPQLGLDIFTRPQRPERAEAFAIDGGQTAWLGDLFLGLIRRVGMLKSAYTVRLEPVSVVNWMMKFVDRLQGVKAKRRSFLLLLRELGGRESSRGTVIGGFMAVLELAKRGMMRTSQGEGNDITVELHLADDDSRVIDIASYRGERSGRDGAREGISVG